MRISVVREGGVISIDGRCVHGIDMSGLDGRLRAMQWYGTHGVEEWQHRPDVKISSLAPYQDIIARAKEAMRKEDDARRMTREDAAAIMKEKIRQRKRNLQQAPFDGIIPSRSLFEMQLLCRFRPPGDPIPTPDPYHGHWLDASGMKRPFTCREFVCLVDEVRERNARIWSMARQHIAAIDHLLSDADKDVDDILSYDFTIGGW